MPIIQFIAQCPLEVNHRSLNDTQRILQVVNDHAGKVFFPSVGLAKPGVCIFQFPVAQFEFCLALTQCLGQLKVAPTQFGPFQHLGGGGDNFPGKDWADEIFFSALF